MIHDIDELPLNDGGLPLRHRRRLIAPLLEGRSVREWRATARRPPGDMMCDVVLQMAALPGPVALARAASMLAGLSPGGLAIVVSEDDLPVESLRRLAPHHAHYTQRRISGSLFCEATFATAQIAVLRDRPAPGDVFHIYIFSFQQVAPLDTGLLETPVPQQASCCGPRDIRPVHAMARPPPPDAGRAASLAGRLLAQEGRTLDLHGRIAQLEAGQARPSSPVTWLEPPVGRFTWKLAENPTATTQSADPYDRRADDPAIRAAVSGREFFDRFCLDAPDAGLAAACAHLAGRTNRLAPQTGAPDVSIVIPVHGQVAYTLNCLDSLFAQESRFSAEIIVIDDASPDDTEALLKRLTQIRYKRQKKNLGFIGSCNHGAAMARGAHVVMLNNDTRVVAGWLDALIDSFAWFPKAGLVGSKALYPDGSLQEAGGIIWRDGSAWNYGRNDDPNRPHYCFARQVDFISGCSIALRRETWKALAGFDSHYAPAYCEDADLCLRIRQSGQEVWFQPQSRVIHYEGQTGGTDLATGTKHHQVLNTKKLFLRWRENLAAHRPNGEAPYLEKSRGVNKRMLVIDAATPRPDQDAGSVQVAMVLQACRTLGYAASFVPQDNFLFQQGYTTDLQARGIECAYAPYELGIETFLRRYGRMFDAIMVYRITVLDRVLAHIRALAGHAIVLFNVVDLHFLRMQRQAALTHDDTLAAEAEDLKGRELDGVRACDCTITHSTVEAALLAEVAPAAPVIVWPLMAVCHGTARGFTERRDVLFLGGYLHSPNVDAVQHFATDILPGLRRSERGLRFIIAGANPTDAVAALASDHIEVTGQIADLRDVMDRARVFVCPLRIGAGVKGKIMSALAYGLPVVTTSVGIEGSGLEPGEHALVADTAAEFIRQTLRLYNDPALWQRLSLAGMALIRREFSPERGAGLLARSIDAAWAHKLGVHPA